MVTSFQVKFNKYFCNHKCENLLQRKSLEGDYWLCHNSSTIKENYCKIIDHRFRLPAVYFSKSIAWYCKNIFFCQDPSAYNLKVFKLWNECFSQTFDTFSPHIIYWKHNIKLDLIYFLKWLFITAKVTFQFHNTMVNHKD